MENCTIDTMNVFRKMCVAGRYVMCDTTQCKIYAVSHRLSTGDNVQLVIV